MQLTSFDWIVIALYGALALSVGLYSEVTSEGFLVASATIARAGVHEYRAPELGIGNGEPDRTIRVFRPEDEVFDASALESFKRKPITDGHPPTGLDATNATGLTLGLTGELLYRQRREARRHDRHRREYATALLDQQREMAEAKPKGSPVRCAAVRSASNSRCFESDSCKKFINAGAAMRSIIDHQAMSSSPTRRRNRLSANKTNPR